VELAKWDPQIRFGANCVVPSNENKPYFYGTLFILAMAVMRREAAQFFACVFGHPSADSETINATTTVAVLEPLPRCVNKGPMMGIFPAKADDD